MNWKKWIPIGIVSAAVLVVGGTFFFQKVIEGSAPKDLSLDSSAPHSSSGPFVANGTWKIASASVVGYRVNEVLFGQKNTAAGRSSSVTGSVDVSNNTIKSGNFSVDMTTFHSNRQIRDNQFNGRIMETSTFPTSTFSFNESIAIGTIPASGMKKTLHATGKLALHGVTKTVSFNIVAVHNGSIVQAAGTIPVVFADYNIQDPSGGPAHTEDHGILEFKLNFARS